MRCYNHQDSEAVAICMGCGKGLCKECDQKNTVGIIACSEICGLRATSQIEMVEQIRKKTVSQTKISGILCILAGIVMILFGFFQITRDNYFLALSIFLFALGISSIFTGVMYFKLSKSEK